MNILAHQVINLGYLNLMADGDNDMKKLMLGMLLTEIPAEITQLKKAHDYQQWEELKRASHKLRTTLSFIGNEQLSALNLEIEQIARYKNKLHLKALPELFENIQELSEQALKEIECELNSLKPTKKVR